ncbi:LysM peptidoglycan-binding domain-containing protein [Aestuariibacter sp. AA17]|uniref:LysM peptidoglycan-binding domain-containing protein n=1 Tax=Fluctibacter corallii TaxID=2984329 RepID=A0ABT3AD08_9ALTE|nr:LysM domain-containing protein [Aestuariibacter sp. AA17]MCV2886568.1 LysM peptidoglycan-binding domain-containing protein [Aestuariibacter sp. AA17]
MIKSVRNFVLVLGLLPLLCIAETVKIKSDAPVEYTVKKGDTLWDISEMYLFKPWLWPELWRNNTHIENPHLIYPGDVLSLQFDEQGNPVLTLTRDAKNRRVLSPGINVNEKPVAVPLISLEALTPFMENAHITSLSEYEGLPQILGNYGGANLFGEGEFVLAHAIDQQNDKTQYKVIRAVQEIERADSIFVVSREVGEVRPVLSDTGEVSFAQVGVGKLEVRPGDRVKAEVPSEDVFTLASHSAWEAELVGSLKGHNLMGKFDVVIVESKAEPLVSGSVLGIYQHGPTIVVGDSPKYQTHSEEVSTILGQQIHHQPAIKVGELIAIKQLGKFNLAIIIDASEVVRQGAWLGNP